MSYTMDDAWHDAWEAEQESYRAAIGYVAVAAAELEYALWEALAWCFPERVEQAQALLAERTAKELLRHFELFFSHEPGVGDLVKRVRRGLEGRNNALHGVVVEFPVLGPEGPYLLNRRRPDKKTPKPSRDDLEALGDLLADSTKDVRAFMGRWPYDPPAT